MLELPKGERSFERVPVHVTVAAWPAAEPERDLANDAARALAVAADSAPVVVRRYRTQPSPLVRDSVRAWRTGRIDRVLAGDFDLIVER